jgi:hypothetical protein
MAVELRSPEKEAFLRMEVLSTGEEVDSSVEVLVEIDAQGFGGREAVWLDHDGLKKFAQSLGELERTRKGRADFTPSDPDFRLSISAMDASGHLLVEFILLRHSLVGHRPRSVDLSVSGGFELDPGTLPGLVREFQDLERVAGSSSGTI